MQLFKIVIAAITLVAGAAASPVVAVESDVVAVVAREPLVAVDPEVVAVVTPEFQVERDSITNFKPQNRIDQDPPTGVKRDAGKSLTNGPHV
ncbi:hypothetical protein FB45DRAFT_944616 [Roridomyces roridus]|uniref:Uncharacterized protein n=1 Tax=Roridomyces roridus TaxID=1738132 RepID=A0AAD7B3C7_9AGAR|nr:hypothetical protein FB45DRAFT_944616 [Roridomyces roridus]